MSTMTSVDEKVRKEKSTSGTGTPCTLTICKYEDYKP